MPIMDRMEWMQRVLLALMFATCLSCTSQVIAAPAVSDRKAAIPLQQTAGWTLPVFGNATLADAMFVENGFTGKLQASGLPAELSPQVFGFRNGKQGPFIIGLIYGSRTLSQFLPSLRGTPLDQIRMDDLVIVLTPGTPGMTVQFPSAIGNLTLPMIGGTTRKLDGTSTLTARPSLTNDLAQLLQQAGASSANLSITGTLDPRLLTGSVPAGSSLESALINAIDLKIPLGSPNPTWKPAFLTFGDSTLVVKGVAGKIAAGISSSLAVNVGNGLHFNAVSINHDPIKRSLSILSSGIAPSGNWLSLPIANASITQLAFSATIDEQHAANSQFLLNGQYSLRNAAPKNFTVTLSGGSPAQYAVSVDAGMTLGQLLGWHIPGLNDLALDNVSAGSNYTSASISLKGLSLPIVAFNSPGQAKPSIALLYKDISLGSLFPALKDLPLNDLHMQQSAWVIAPGGSSGQASASSQPTPLPAPLKTHLGYPANQNLNMQLNPGINLTGTIALKGGLRQLFSSAGFSGSSGSGSSPEVSNRPSGGSPAMPSLGTLPLDIFNSLSGGSIAQELINQIDLSLPLGSPNPTWKPAFLTFGDSTLVVKGVAGKIAAGISSSLAVNVGNGLHFNAVSINHDPIKRSLSILSSGIAPSGNWLSLPIANASITQLAFSATIDEQHAANSQFLLNGQYSLRNAAPKNFTVTLSGGSPAQYAVSVDAGMTLGQLLGWHPPGLDAIAIQNVQIANDYTSGTLTLQGLEFTVMAFKTAGMSATSAAFIYDAKLTLPTLLSALNGTPLADLELAHGGFILSPQQNGTRTVQFPSAVSSRLGVSSLELKPGLNLNAQAKAVGALASLLGKLNLSASSLPLKGTLDPSLLSSSAKQLAKEFVSAIDLHLPLGRVALPGVKQGVSLDNALLALKGIENGNGIDASVQGSLNVAAGSSSLQFNAAVHLVKDAGAETLSLSGTYPSIWNRPLGIPWLNVRNVTLGGSIGQTNAVAISGTTDVGNVHNLKITLDLTEKPGQTPEVELDLTGADIPLSDLPGLSQIPNAKDFKLRDLTLASDAIGGTLKTNLSLLKDARAVAFTSGGKWNLAVLLENLSLPQLLPLPSFAKPILNKAHLDKLAFVFSEAGISTRVADLPRAAASEMTAIFGNANGMLRIGSGLNLLSSLDPAKLSPEVGKMIPGGGKLALQGGINGVFGGTPSLDLAAVIPPITMPPTLKFVVLPTNFETAFFINLTQTSIATGIMIDTEIDVRMKNQTVAFDTAIAFQLDSGGGVSIDLQGKTLRPWRNPLGINGFTMDTGTRIEVKVSATSEVTLTIVGKSHIGNREVDLTGSASILAAEGVIDKGAFEGKVSEIGIEDLMALTNAVVSASGGAPIQHNLPVLKLTNADVAFASPGVSIPEMNLDGGGIRIAGDLWFLLKNQALGKAMTQISANGLIMNGKMADFSVGPVAFKNNMLDTKAILMPPTPPYFKIHGGVSIFGKKQDAGLSAAFTDMEMVADLDLGDLMKFDFRATAGTPQGGLSPQDLLKYDMNLNTHLKSDIPAWLRKDGKKPVEAVIGGMKKGLDQFITDLNNAQKTVDELNKKIDDAKAKARKAAKSTEQNLANAQSKVDSLDKQIRKLSSDISDAKGHIHKCDYTKSVRVFGKKISAPDVGKNARCATENVSYGAKVASLETQKDGVIIAKTAADKTLATLKSGVSNVDAADLDPNVIALEADLTVATGAHQVAKQMAQGAEQGSKLIDNAINRFAEANLFVLKDSLIEGSLQKAIAGKPVVMGMLFEVAGNVHHMGFALSFTDPAFTLKQLDALALFVFSKIIEAEAKGNDNVPPGLAKLVHEAYLAKADAVADELDKAMKANGLE